MLVLARQSREWAGCARDQRKSCGRGFLFVMKFLYLQGEADDFEALLHCVKLLLVESVAHYVRP